jgi:hypothetical protein
MGHSKGSPKRKVLAMSAYIERSKRSQISDLILQLKLFEKTEPADPKTSRRREVIKNMG